MMARHLHLEYVYEGDPDNARDSDHKSVLTHADLTNLPSDLRHELHNALLRLNTTGTTAAIEKIIRHDSEVGCLLMALGKRLEYTSLLKLLEDTEETHGGPV